MQQSFHRRVSFGYRPDLISGGLSCWLDHARWLAALAVASAHLRNLLFPDQASLPQIGHPLSIFGKLFYFFTLFGEQSVVIFFVMSGLLVGGTILRRLKQGRFHPSAYAVDRLSRLLSALVPAVVLSVGFQYFGNMAVDCSAQDTPGTIISNLLFLQNFTSTPLCNDHPLWSLSSEGWFYVIGPLIAALVFRPTWQRATFVGAALIPAVLTFLPSHGTPLFGLMLWLIGFAPWFITIRLPLIALAFPLLAGLILSRVHALPGQFIDLLWIAFGFALLLSAKSQTWRSIAPKTAKNMAAFSYSLYLIHMPIAQMAAFWIGRQSLMPGQISSYGLYFFVLTFTVAVAWLFGTIFEKRTEWLRDKLHTIINYRPTKLGEQP